MSQEVPNGATAQSEEAHLRAEPGASAQSPGAPTLRQRAESMADGIDASAGRDVGPEAAMNAFHELRVHQIELEMQNEELRRAEQEIQRSQALYQDLYDNAAVGFITLDAGGHIVEANLSAAETVGVKRDDLPGQSFTQFILAADQDKFYLMRKRLLASRATQWGNLQLRSLAGVTAPVRLAVTTAHDPEGLLESRITIIPAVDGSCED